MGIFFNRNFLRVLVFVAIFSSFFLKGVNFLDPDFGWRIAAGQMYYKSGIPKTDPFSYTMPDFEWVDHAWVTSLIMGRGYDLLGSNLLSLLFAGFATLSILIVSTLVKSKLDLPGKGIWKLIDSIDIPLISIFSILFLFFGIRAQIFSWFCFSIFLWLTWEEKRFEKTKWFLPVLFTIWANLHGSFLIGLCTYLVLSGIHMIKQNKIVLSHIMVILLSILSTLINPYGIGIWREVLSSVLDFTLTKRIVEWMPALTMINFVMIFYVAYSFTFVWVKKYKLELSWTIIYVIFLVASMSSRRHLPLWMLISYPLTTTALNRFYISIKKIKFGSERFVKLYGFVWIIAVFTAVSQFVVDGKNSISVSESDYYPKGAVEFIKTNRLEGRVFSDYAWGGYLIWKMPEKKVFIDGRMPSWRDGGGYKVMDEYVDFLTGKSDIKEIVDKHEIKYVLWNNLPETQVDSNAVIGKLGKLLGMEEKDFDIKKSLNNLGWKVIYQDSVSIIYAQN